MFCGAGEAGIVVQILNQKYHIGEEGVRNKWFEVWARMSERLVGLAWFG